MQGSLANETTKHYFLANVRRDDRTEKEKAFSELELDRATLVAAQIKELLGLRFEANSW
jgi:hypothetical protein